MAQEIEKKFLIKNDSWRSLGTGKEYCQGYLSSEKGRTVRIRTIGDRGILTIKGASEGDSRLEFEYDIPLEEAKEMLEKLCQKPLITKTRYKIPYAQFIWEVDEFEGENKGLIFAEIELQFSGQPFEIPEWIGEEVTGDQRYYNANLVSNPYSNWEK
ncbi:MAG: CYTH domain-containing protein [Desulfobulbaceae bacterium]|nr:CYTH domain-containing protein [Desulfobulbaceae bacterium]